MGNQTQRDATEPIEGAAYGVRFTGLAPSPTLALYGVDSWYAVEVTVATPRLVNIRVAVDENGATAGYESVQVRIDRPRRRVEISTVDALDQDTLAHPYLGLAGAFFAHWSGKESVHAAAAIVGGRAWGLVGNSEQGKSTVAAALLAAGHDVLVDDVLVTDGAHAFAGPRCIDLRDGVGARLGLSLPIARARTDSRDRIYLPPIDGSAPLGGFAHLVWADDPEPAMVKLPIDERVKRQTAARSVPYLSAHDEVILDLATLPAWEFRRPHRWDRFERATAVLIDTLGTAAGA